MQYTFVDDDTEAAPIYRLDGKASQPIRPCKNHGLHIEHIPPWTESQYKAADAVIGSSCTRIIGKYDQNPGNTEMHIISVVRFRLAPHTVFYGLMLKEPLE